MKLSNVLLGAAFVIASTLYAQAPANRITAAFATPVEVNGVTLPAGNVSIQMVSDNGGVFLVLRSDSGVNATALVNRSLDSTSDVSAARIVLDQRNGAYHLQKVILPDHTILTILGQ